MRYTIRLVCPEVAITGFAVLGGPKESLHIYNDDLSLTSLKSKLLEEERRFESPMKSSRTKEEDDGNAVLTAQSTSVTDCKKML